MSLPSPQLLNLYTKLIGSIDTTKTASELKTQISAIVPQREEMPENYKRVEYLTNKKLPITNGSFKIYTLEILRDIYESIKDDTVVLKPIGGKKITKSDYREAIDKIYSNYINFKKGITLTQEEYALHKKLRQEFLLQKQQNSSIFLLIKDLIVKKLHLIKDNLQALRNYLKSLDIDFLDFNAHQKIQDSYLFLNSDSSSLIISFLKSINKRNHNFDQKLLRKEMIDMISKYCDKKKIIKPKNLEKMTHSELYHFIRNLIENDEFYLPPININCFKDLLIGLALESHLSNLDKSVIELDFMGSMIRNEGAVILSRYLPGFKELESLELAANDIENEGMIAISKVLPKLKKLRYLGIKCNSVGSSGMIALANVLPMIPNLSYFYLGDNRYDKFGMMALCKAFTKMKNLKELNFGGQDFDDEMKSVLVKCLSNMDNLEILYFDQCKLKDKDIINLIIPILDRHEKNLTELDLSGNQITYTGVVELVNKLESCSKMNSLNLEYNPIGIQGAKLLQEKASHIDKLLFDDTQVALDKQQQYEMGDEVCGIFEIQGGTFGESRSWYLEQELEEDDFNKLYTKWEDINGLVPFDEDMYQDFNDYFGATADNHSYSVVGKFEYKGEYDGWYPIDYVIIIDNLVDRFHDLIKEIFDNPKKFDKNYIIKVFQFVQNNPDIKQYILEQHVDFPYIDLFKKIIQDPKKYVQELYLQKYSKNMKWWNSEQQTIIKKQLQTILSQQELDQINDIDPITFQKYKHPLLGDDLSIYQESNFAKLPFKGVRGLPVTKQILLKQAVQKYKKQANKKVKLSVGKDIAKYVEIIKKL